MKANLRKLNEHDSFHLRAAEGWFELGDLVSASNELEEITAKDRAHPAVLIMRYEIYAKALKWDMAGAVAEALLKMLPEDAESWLNMAFTIRHKTGGSVRDAREILLEAEPKFPSEFLIPYHLACYCSVLHEFKETERWIKKALSLNEKEVQRMVLDDPDLRPFWDTMTGTLWRKE